MVNILLFFSELFALFLLSRLLTRDLSSLLFRLTHSKSITIAILSFLFLPGTIVHEVSHYLMAHLVFVPAGKLEVVPKMEERGVKLGSVAIARTDPFRRLFIGIAPFLIGTIIILITLFYVINYDLLDAPLAVFVTGYILFEVGNTMFSSRKDMEGALELLLAVLILFAITYFLGFHLSSFNPETLLPDSVIQMFTTGSRLLLIPLAIDIVVIAALRVAKRII